MKIFVRKIACTKTLYIQRQQKICSGAKKFLEFLWYEENVLTSTLGKNFLQSKKKSETTEFLAFSQFINNYMKKKKISEQVGDALLL